MVSTINIPSRHAHVRDDRGTPRPRCCDGLTFTSPPRIGDIADAPVQAEYLMLEVIGFLELMQVIRKVSALVREQSRPLKSGRELVATLLLKGSIFKI